jgi:cell division protein FtsQ
MAEKRKISIRKVLQAFTTLVVTVGCIIAIVSASRIEDKKMLKKVAIHIKNSKKYHFIEQNEVYEKAITNLHVDVMNTPIGRLDLQSMEQVLKTDPWIADAQVYIDNDGVLNLFVTQRVPVARLFSKDAGSFYMDSSLSIMPLSSNYIFYTTVVTNVPQLRNDSISSSLKKQILCLVKMLQSDTFWNTQVSQIVIDSVGTFELVPVLGNQKIILGDTSRMKEKLDNLFTFYKNVLNRIGWDKYETLDLRYRNQVVASPSLPYKGPVDRAVAGMNWISSIVETEAKNEAIDTTKDKDDDMQADSKKPEDKIKTSDKKETKIAIKKEDKGKPPKEKKKPDKHKLAENKKKGKKPPG